MGRSGSRLIEFIRERHGGEERVETVRLEPTNEHGLLGWLIRSYIPSLKSPVKPINLGGCGLLYIVAPKWGYGCPPVSGFIESHNLRGLKAALIVTYSKGNPSSYSRRIARRIERKGASLLGVVELGREEILSGSFAEKVQLFCDLVASGIGRTNLSRGHVHEIVLWGMVNVTRDGYIQGVVDVYGCRRCKKMFCDDRRYGEGLAPGVGFQEIPDDEGWGILTCTDSRGVFMQSLPVKPGKKLSHKCKDGRTLEFTVNDRCGINRGDGKEVVHRLFMVRDYVNRTIEAGYYKLKMLKRTGVKPDAPEE